MNKYAVYAIELARIVAAFGMEKLFAIKKIKIE